MRHSLWKYEWSESDSVSRAITPAPAARAHICATPAESSTSWGCTAWFPVTGAMLVGAPERCKPHGLIRSRAGRRPRRAECRDRLERVAGRFRVGLVDGHVHRLNR